MPVIYFNGTFVEQMDAALDPLDRGVLLGDGVFETIRCEQGQVLFHLAHFSRLARSARLVHIPFNLSSEDLLNICHQVIDANNLQDARLRVTLTRGESSGGLGLAGRSSAPTLIVHALEFDQDHYDKMRLQGWKAGLVSFPKNHHSPLAQVKSTSYLEVLMARHEVGREGFDEGVFLNTDGLIAEGTMTNLFLVKGESVLTSPVSDGALPGTIRLKIGMIANRLGLEYREESLALGDLETADEAFFTNVMIEVMPLVKFRSLLIGSGRMGMVTERLYREHRQDIAIFLSRMKEG
jgi:branched-chain amino acid aminotransferase